jgi:hypothetical protein
MLKSVMTTILVLILLAAWNFYHPKPRDDQKLLVIQPVPVPSKDSGRRLRPRADFETMTVGGPTTPDGKTTVACDHPVSQRQHNTGGRDGAGLCVFTSIEHAARYQHVPALENFQAYMTHYPGGGYPQKVDTYIAKLCKEKNLPKPQYLQYEGKDPAILKAAIASGRMPSVTYDGHDPHYRGSIAHMVSLIALTENWACILDNNFVGENELVWMSPAEFLQRWRGDGGWAVILLAPPPPPVPRN